MTLPQDPCAGCGKMLKGKAIRHQIPNREGVFCSACYADSFLVDFTDDAAQELVNTLRRAGHAPDRILTHLNRTMRGPDTPRRWAPAGVWHALDVADYSTRHWKHLREAV